LSKDYDCVILGMTRDSWLRQRFLGSKPGQFAGQVEPPIVIVQPRSSSVAYGLYRVRHYLRGGYRVVGASAEKELTEQGILLPQKEAQRLVPPTFAQSLPTLIGGIGALIGVALMYFGYGTSTTWLGAVIYILSLFFFTIMTVRAVKA
jgi:hypothetical protein